MPEEAPLPEKLFKQVRHPIRQSILYELQKQPLRFNDLSRQLDVDKSNLAYHLRQMKSFVQKEDNYYSLSPLGDQILQSIENAPGSILRDTIRYGIDLIILYSFMSGLLVGIGAGLLTRFLTDASLTLQFNFVLLAMALPAIISGTIILIQNNRLILFFGRESKKLPEGFINTVGMLGGWMVFFLYFWILFVSVLVVLAPVSLIRQRANFEYVKLYLRPLYSPRKPK
ncbi:MAG: winged helix-turn-helix domain-containing protein [Candidatus Ranarchaeia archaeon]